MVADAEAEVEDGDDDRELVLGDEEPHQASLEHVGGEEGEKHDDEGEHQTHILNTEIEIINFQRTSVVLIVNNFSELKLNMNRAQANGKGRLCLKQYKQRELIFQREFFPGPM